MKHVIPFVVGLFCYSVSGIYWCFFSKNILRLTSNCIILLCLYVFSIWKVFVVFCFKFSKKLPSSHPTKKLGDLFWPCCLPMFVQSIDPPWTARPDGSGRWDKWMATHDLHRDLVWPSSGLNVEELAQNEALLWSVEIVYSLCLFKCWALSIPRLLGWPFWGQIS